MHPILPGAPWLIAHRSMLGVNKTYKITLNDRDYVLWQNQKGEVFGLDNIRQDTQTIENLYSRQKHKIHLPNEEIMFYAQKLYQEW